MKAIVDEDICIGCELCADTCPEIFEMVDDKAVVHVDPVPIVVEDRCQKAAYECPVSAISFE